MKLFFGMKMIFLILKLVMVRGSLESVEKSDYRSNKQCPKSKRHADSSEVLEIPPQKQPVDVNAALVETAVKIISEESTVSEDELVPGTNRDEDRPRTPDRDIENMDEVLEKTRRAHATFIPENKTENHLKQSLNLANSLDHVAIESTDIDSVRKVIYIKVHCRVRVPRTGLGPIFQKGSPRTVNLGRRKGESSDKV